MKKNFTKTYLDKIKQLSTDISINDIAEMLQILEDTLEKKKTIYIAGNGGSASTASHMVCDLAKGTGKPFKVISLSDNIPLLTAVGNDISYDKTLSLRLENLGQEGDLLLAITGSGNSKNIIEVIKTAKKLKMDTLALLGFDGGKVKDMVGHYVLVPSNEYGPVEDFHLILDHLATAYFQIDKVEEKKTKALFLDRDGVINEKAKKGDYIKNWKEFKFIPNIEKLIKTANKEGYLVIVVTNQRGIGKGLMTNYDLSIIHSKMIEALADKNAFIDRIYYCPHLKSDNCNCRKPKPGMLLQAVKDFNIDMSKSLLIGDRETDIQAGLSAGCTSLLMKQFNGFMEFIFK